MEHTLYARGIKHPIFPCPTDFSDSDPQGNRIDFTNYYMRYNSKPYFAVSGELHFSRLDPRFWEDEIIKMKMAGITMISTYLFWIHHEEIKGQFDWEGCRDLRRFVALCKKQGIYVILRVGPFSHGECRNGGLPDWMFGAPYDIRSNDPEYLFYVERYFGEIGRQVAGLLYKDGGPIVSVQIENEYEHASAPWEPATGSSGEWTASGNDGPSHIQSIKRLAIEAGLVTPLYSTTAWGGACAPVDAVLPLWGGYAYRPWIFYGDGIREHPATAEYVYRDFHSNLAPEYPNFDRQYPPETLPFVCCEMGGGMACFYPYRFQLPYESVEALANVKAAGGCNFLGYYMYHGGTNPKGKRAEYLNECALPKISYDYQAAIGEYGQLRESYHRTRLLHYLFKDFEEVFCPTKTVLPPGADALPPEDADTLRYCARVRGDRGFLFLNNFQDHVEMHPQRDFAIRLELEGETLRVPAKGALSLAENACAVLPLNLALEGGVLLRYATAQPITRLRTREGACYFFFAPAGMEATLCLDGATAAILRTPGTEEEKNGSRLVRLPADTTTQTVVATPAGERVSLFVLSRRDSLRFWPIRRPEGDFALLCDQAVLDGAGGLRIESLGEESGEIAVFPRPGKITAGGADCAPLAGDAPFARFRAVYGQNRVEMRWQDVSSKEKATDGALKRPVVGSPITSTKVVNARARVQITPASFACCKQILLRVAYSGDIGYAFTEDDALISDNFCNGAPWEFGLKAYEQRVARQGLHLYVSPRRKGGRVNSDSQMAARFATYDEAWAHIDSIEAVPVFDCPLELGE